MGEQGMKVKIILLLIVTMIGSLIFIPGSTVCAESSYVWSCIDTGIQSNLVSVAWNGSKYVTVGYGGKILTSGTSGTWTLQNSGTTEQLNDVVWNGNMFVVVGNEGTILTSVDGISWTLRNSGMWANINSVVWSNNSFIAVGTLSIDGWNDNGFTLKSTDGIYWKPDKQFGVATNKIFYCGNKFIILGHANGGGGGRILTSSDGTVWRESILPGPFRFSEPSGIAWDGKTFVLAAGEIAYTSKDAVSWQYTALDKNIYLNWFRGICFNGEKFAAVGDDGKISTSVDGVSWVFETSPTKYNINDIIWDGYRFIAVGDKGAIVYGIKAGNGGYPTPTPTPTITPTPVITPTPTPTPLDRTAPTMPAVNSVDDNDKTITGKAEALATVFARKGNTVIGASTAKTDGRFTILIPVQKAGTILQVIAKDAAGNESIPAQITIRDVTPPSVPIINTIKSTPSRIVGKAEAGAAVVIKKGSTVLGFGFSKADGTFSITILPQKKNTVLFVTAKDEQGNVSKAAKVVVKDNDKGRHER
jgi:hypothetical protein